MLHRYAYAIFSSLPPTLPSLFLLFFPHCLFFSPFPPLRLLSTRNRLINPTQLATFSIRSQRVPVFFFLIFLFFFFLAVSLSVADHENGKDIATMRCIRQRAKMPRHFFKVTFQRSRVLLSLCTVCDAR